MEIDNIPPSCGAKGKSSVAPLKERGLLHPAVQIYMWCLLSLTAQIIGGEMLILLAIITILLSLRMNASRFIFLLRRTRWILIPVFLVYSYTTPGEMLWPQMGMFSPVIVGVEDGMLQLLRLVTVLAGLSILLGLLSQSQLISGFYTLSRPLMLLGLSRERIAVRLALTLRYAESAIQNTASNWSGSFEHMLAQQPVTPEFIEMQTAPFSLVDRLLFATVSAAFFGLCL